MPPERSHVLLYSLVVPLVVIATIPILVAEVAKAATRPVQKRLITEPRRREDERLAQQNARVYLPLRSDGREIRLIKLLPAKQNLNVIECVSFHRERDAESYEALSYAWGDTHLKHLIKVDGLDFAVTKNLHVALKNLRYQDTSRTLWIDAICINQIDDEERSNQVKQMQFIYESALNVVVWLEDPPEKFEQLSNLFEPSVTIDSKLREDSRARVFQKLLLRSWWKRMWVIQEVLLAKNVTMQTGKYIIPWQRFCELFELLEGKISLRHGDWDAPFARSLINLRMLRESRKDPQHGLLSLAWEFRKREANDDRDRLYALLGLLPQKDRIIAPDYSQKTEVVYKEFTRAWINAYKSLFIVNLVQFQAIDGRSWYIRWAKTSYEDPPKHLFWGQGFTTHDKSRNDAGNPWEGKFSASGGYPAPDCTHENENILRLKGFIYGTIQTTGEICDEPTFGSSKYYKETMKEWRELAVAETDLNEAELGTKFYRTVTAGLYETPPDTGEADMVQFEKILRETCNKRRFFTTSEGSFGLGPANLREKDVACVLLGSSVPFILTEENNFILTWSGDRVKDSKTQESASTMPAGTNHENESSTKWKFVGDAYLDDIMIYRGDINSDVMSGKLALREFLLY